MRDDSDPSGWQLLAADRLDEASLTAAVIAAHRRILDELRRSDPLLNTALGIEVRAYRPLDDWRVLLLLTPWMLARLFVPQQPPPIPIPPGWSASERRDAPYQVLGPALEIRLLDQPQRAHIHHDPDLGHYLLQPLCLDMTPYRDAEACFDAWAEVIRIRDENMEQAQRDCPLQRDISRRELFARILPRD
ncbi:[NiFe]-hydrogenase assembly chaperone HybE [Thioalkalicoccus limnaeus]|uniref:[NiFe]-hydrogenase assembly chaperone HybE n=1 Tax=Thioalkalicoccus limnaeus TaxID=120681 RepID=A0ABV4BAN2_9GAMM